MLKDIYIYISQKQIGNILKLMAIFGALISFSSTIKLKRTA